MAEQTVLENMTEETKTDNQTTVLSVNWATFSLLSVLMLTCGWVLFLMSLKENDNVDIPDHMWFFSAAFQVFATAIWIDIIVACYQSKRTQSWEPLSSIMLFICLTSCLLMFIWFCSTRDIY